MSLRKKFYFSNMAEDDQMFPTNWLKNMTEDDLMFQTNWLKNMFQKTT